MPRETSPTPPKNVPHSPAMYRRHKHLIEYMKAVIQVLPKECNTHRKISQAMGGHPTENTISQLVTGHRMSAPALRKISEYTGISYEEYQKNAGPDDVFYVLPWTGQERPGRPTKPITRTPTVDTQTPPTTPSPVDTIAAGNPELRLLSAMVTYSVGISPAGIERALDWFRSYRGLTHPSGN